MSGLPAVQELARRHRLQWWEALPWAAGLAAFFLFPNYLAFGTQVLVTILFALSLDLVLGYAGIVTLGHAAFFGAGAYTVGMLATHWGWTEPLSGLLAAALVAGVVGLASGWVLLRTHGLTLLMLTLCTMALLEQAANMFSAWTGGFDGMPGLSFKPVLGVFEFDVLYFRSQYLYALAVLLVCFVVVRTLVYSPFGRSPTDPRTYPHARGRALAARQVVAYATRVLAGVAGGVRARHRHELAVLGLERGRSSS
jgi:branched-chain amino acid transport system permease protein